MAHVFISYAKKDTRDLALRLHEMLNTTPGFTAWMDETLVPGKSWARSIEREIDRADFVVVLLSPDVNRPEEDDQPRSFVLNEIDYAQQIGKTIIPLMAQRTRQPIQMAGLQYIDLTVNETMGLQRLMMRLGVSSVPPAPKPAPTPARPDKKKTDSSIRAAYIAGAFLLISVVIAGIFGLWQGYFTNLSADTLLTPATQAALQPTDSPTDDPTPTLTPTESSTPDIEEAARQLLAQQTAQAIIDQATATVARATQDYALNQTQIANLTATATLWTATPTPTITPTPTLAPVTRNDDWTPVSQMFDTITLMGVPPGCFNMGENGEGGRQCFDAPFWIGETEVTNAQYAEFVSAGGYNEQRYWTDAGWAWKTENNRTAPRDYGNFTDDNQPRVGVSWYEAVAYTQWLTEQLRASGSIGQEEEIRLPTESEWEYAARGPDGLTYPWGNTFDGTRLNFCDTNCGYDWRDATVDDGYGSVTAPVGSYPLGASWVGALDMSGNVWEWSLSGYAEYPYVGTDGRNGISENITYRVLRGGSFNLDLDNAAASFRNLNDPLSAPNDYGVRLVLSAPYASLSSEAP